MKIIRQAALLATIVGVALTSACADIGAEKVDPAKPLVRSIAPTSPDVDAPSPGKPNNFQESPTGNQNGDNNASFGTVTILAEQLHAGPMPGQDVGVTRVDCSSFEVIEPLQTASQSTDGNGSATFSGLALGCYKIISSVPVEYHRVAGGSGWQAEITADAPHYTGVVQLYKRQPCDPEILDGPIGSSGTFMVPADDFMVNNCDGAWADVSTGGTIHVLRYQGTQWVEYADLDEANRQCISDAKADGLPPRYDWMFKPGC